MPQGVRLAVQVTPNARKTEVVGLIAAGEGVALKIKLQAQPVEGQANAVLLKWLAKTLGVARGAVVITHGSSSRSKLVEIRGISVDAVAALLAPP
ncbi:DUF167 domain-containing protein [Massilia sp. PWRC2]|uniref:DUF167 domain-containing protein n=1 Tax=Massilia sp. PWRC2 TaxID=2804626 RepID=UPI003CF05BCD